MTGKRYFRTRYFTNTIGNSSKFWSIRVNPGASYTVKFGRIGTGGQTREKMFPSQWEAQKAVGRIIEAKLNKGYLETGEVAEDALPMMVLAEPETVPPKAKRRKKKTVKPKAAVEPGRVISFEEEV